MQKQLDYYIRHSCRRFFNTGYDVDDYKRLLGHKGFCNQQFVSEFNAMAVKEVQLLLHQAIIAPLHSSGESPMNAIMWYLNNKGVLIDSNNNNFKSLYSALEEILGPTTDTITEDITKQLCVHYRIDSGCRCSQADNEHAGALYQIQQILDLILKYREA
jgi:hypothetical protein